MKLLAVAVFIAAAASPARATVEITIRDFYSAYAAGNLDAAAAQWTSDAAPAFRVRNERTLKTRCMILHHVSIDDLRVDGERATAHVEALLSRWSAMPGATPEPERQRVTMQLRRELAGWRIDAWKFAEEELAERLASLPRTDAEAVLRSEPDLWTRRLVDLLCRRAVLLNEQRKPGDAADALALANLAAENLGDPAARARVLGVESLLARAHPRNDSVAGLAAAEVAIDAATQAQDPDVLGRALLELSRSAELASLPNPLEPCQRALALADLIEDPAVVSLAASQLARLYYRFGRPRASMRYAWMAATWARSSDDPTAAIRAEMYLASNYYTRGDLDVAVVHVQKVLDLAEREGFVGLKAAAIKNFGICEDRPDNTERFFELTGRALEILGPDGAITDRIPIHVNRAQHWVTEGNLARAEAELQIAEELLSCLPDGSTADSYLRHVTAMLRVAQRRYPEAIRAASRDEGYLGSWLIAQALRGMGRDEEARRSLERAVELIEGARGEIDHELQRGYFLNDASRVYVLLIEWMIEAGENRAALAMAERLKARALKDRFAEAASRGTSPEPRAQRPARIDAENRRARVALEEALAGAGPPDAAPPAWTTARTRDLHLPPRMTVVEFVLGDRQTFAFLLRGTRLEVRTIAIDRRALERQIAELVRTMELRDGTYRTKARRLYDLLLRPSLGDDPSGTLCIVPDAGLWTLPFQALITPSGRHLIEHAAVYYAPSLAMLSNHPAAQFARRAPTVLALGNPDVDPSTKEEIRTVDGAPILGGLPDAETEVEALPRIYGRGVTVRTRSFAAEKTLKRDASRFDIVHIAAHAVVDSGAPLDSALLLAGSGGEDGLLEAREIAGMNLRADLVVLSACNTARGRIVGGEGVVGFSWAILASGCPRAIATQWRVGSAAASRLMIAFHQRLAAAHATETVADSLRAAQLEVLRSRYAHPYYWAGFVLVGRQ